MKSSRNNIFKKAIHHLKSNQIDEKLQLLSEIPTNNAAGIYIVEPGYQVQDPDIPGDVTKEVDFLQDDPNLNGRDTSGLFDTDDTTILTIEPPGDTSYILGPMASMWYAWGNFSTIGYIRQSDRRMVDLGRITGRLGSWNGVSNFTSYGQLTLEQAVWFRDTPKLNGADNNTPNYRAFYPGPPSNTPDQYGRYLCVITGTPKPTTVTPPPRRVPPTTGPSNPTDNFALQLHNKKKKQPEIAGIGPYGPGHMPEPIPPANQSPRGPYTPIKDYGTPGNPKFMPSGPSKNPWGVGNKNPKPKKSMVASYEPRGIVLSEKKKKILKEIKKPYVLPEQPKVKYKIKPRVNRTVNSDLMKKAEVPSSFVKPEERLWGKYEKDRNSRMSQERKNEVLDHLGGSDHFWEYMTETSRQKSNDIMYGHFGGKSKKGKIVRKEELKGDTLLFIADETGKKESILQSELSIRLADEFNKEIFQKYFQEQETLQADKDPLFKKISKVIKKEINYSDKPSKNGYPNESPPEMVNGMHPDLVDGKKIADRFNRLDPQSAKSIPLTGNPHIDKKVKAARKKPK